jgi:hypothetical protein
VDQKIVKLTYLFEYSLIVEKTKRYLVIIARIFICINVICVYEIDVQGDNEKRKFLTITDKFTKHHNKNLKS